MSKTIGLFFLSCLLGNFTSASTIEPTNERLKGTWNLAAQKCVADGKVFGTELGLTDFIPMPDAMTVRFTATRFDVDVKHLGCQYRLSGAYTLNGDVVRYHSERLVRRCARERAKAIPLRSSPFRVAVRGDRLIIRGLLSTAGFCSVTQTPEFFLERR